MPSRLTATGPLLFTILSLGHKLLSGCHQKQSDLSAGQPLTLSVPGPLQEDTQNTKGDNKS